MIGRIGGAIVIAGAVAAVIATFLPWLSVTAPFAGTVTESIMQGGGNDGPILATFAVIAALLGVLIIVRGPAWWANIAAILALALAGAVAAYDLSNAQNSVPEFIRSTGLVSATVEVGVYVCAAGVLVGVFGAGMGFWPKARAAAKA